MPRITPASVSNPTPVNPFASAVGAYSNAAALYSPGQDYTPIIELLRSANADMAHGVKLLSTGGAPAGVVQQASLGLTGGRWVEAQADIRHRFGYKVSEPLGLNPEAVFISDALNGAKVGAAYLSSLLAG